MLKIRKKQQDEAKATKQFGEPSESLPDPELRPQLTTNAPAAAQRKAPSTTSATVERQPMQRYRRRWKKAVPGLDEFARRIQMPEGVQLKILGGSQARHPRLHIDTEHRKANRKGSQGQVAVIRFACSSILEIFIHEFNLLRSGTYKHKQTPQK